LLDFGHLLENGRELFDRRHNPRFV
jgi:hypothetical protein